MGQTGAGQKAEKIAVLVAFACVLQIAESMIPHPVPGLRLGLPNMLTLTALILLGFGPAMEVAVLRTLLSSFIMGTFMSPSFLLSFSGAVVSTAVMGLFYRLSGSHRCFRLSVVGISIVGAFTHNLIQLSLAYLLLIRHPGIFVFFPWLSLGAVATGWVVGAATGGICRRLSAPAGLHSFTVTASVTPASFDRHYESSASFLHGIPPAVKLIFVFLTAASVFLIEQWWFFSCLFLFLLFLAAFSGIPPSTVLLRIRRYAVLIAVAFMLPVFFHRGVPAVADAGVLDAAGGGLRQGGLFAFRIFLLLFASTILLRTTSPRELTRGLHRLFLPFECMGFPARRTAIILSLAWEAVPGVWATMRSAIAGTDFSRAGNIKKLIPLLSDLIAAVYIRAGSENRTLKGGKQ